jgi:hypothetical protein
MFAFHGTGNRIWHLAGKYDEHLVVNYIRNSCLTIIYCTWVAYIGCVVGKKSRKCCCMEKARHQTVDLSSSRYENA